MLESININRLSEVNFLRNVEADGSASHDHSVGREAGNALQRFEAETEGDNTNENRVGAESETNTSEERVSGSEGGPKTDEQLTEEEKREVQRLKEIDRKVRQHEMAHLAAAAGIAVSGANFEYQRGPDGVNYAVGGEVSIDVSKESDPDATIEKARKISAAALAPADPSPQDRQVAAKARAMEAEARVEKTQEQQEEAAETEQVQENQGPVEPTIEGSVQPGNENQNTGIAENRRESEDGSPAEAAAAASDQQHPGIQAYRQNQAFAPFSDVFTNPNSASGTETPAFNAGAATAIAASSAFRLDLVA